MAPFRTALALALGALALVPATARAATVSLPVVPGPCDIVCSKYQGTGAPEAQFHLDAATGEANAVTLSLAGATVTVRDDGAPLTPGENCTRIDDHAASCAAPGGPTPATYDIALGDGNDTFAASGPITAPMTIDGGPGDDVITGGGGPDVIDGGGGHDRLSGGDGADILVDGDPPTGGDADVLDGGPGRDTIDYSSRTAGVRVDLAAGTGPDGDAIRGIENVLTGSGDDVVTGDAGANVIDAGRGRDVIDGGPGNDTLNTRDGAADTVTCGAGLDTVSDSALGAPDPEYGLRQPYLVGPDPVDVLALDCERTVFGARTDVDGTYARVAPLRIAAHALVLRTPCRCAGRVTVSSAAATLGAVRFTARSRRVVVRSHRRFQGVVELRWRSGRRTGAWSVALPGPR